MATINAILITSKIRQPVKVKFRYREGNSIDLLYTSSIKVIPTHWDTKLQAIKINCPLPTTERNRINNEVQKIKNLIINFIESTNDLINNSSLKNFIENTYNVKPKSLNTAQSGNSKNFFTLFDTFLQLQPLSDERREGYIVVLNALKRFEYYKKQSDKGFVLNFTTFTETILIELENYLAAEYNYIKLNRQFKKQFPKYKSNKPRSQNTINGNLSKVRTFFNWCIKRKYTNSTPFSFFKLKASIYGTPYYPTKEEILKIYHHNYSDKTLHLQSRIFVFQCMTGPRVGDLYRLKRNNIVDDALVYIPEKQKHQRATTLIVPLNEIAKQIIRDYSNKADESLFNFCSFYHYNKFIKLAFKMANIQRTVAILDPLSGEEVMKDINEIISSHAARRFFIGTIYNEVQDPNLIGELSGHAYGSRSFSRYRNVNSDIKRKLVSILDEKNF